MVVAVDEVAHLEAFAEKHGHGEVCENLKAEIEDRYFPGRRRAREYHESAYRARLVEIEAVGVKLPGQGHTEASAYLVAAFEFLARERTADREPDQVAWRRFDRDFAEQLNDAESIDPDWGAALTRLSPAAIRSVAAIERQGSSIEVVVKDYGKDLLAKGRTDIRKSTVVVEPSRKSGRGVPAA